MNTIPDWSDRQFKFDLPLDFYPNVLARVRGTPARLEDAVRGLSEEQLKRRDEGKFSIQENAGHLLDVEDLFEKRLQEFLGSERELTSAGYRNPARPHRPHHERRIAEIVHDFRTIREAEIEILARLSRDDFARTAWHPRLRTPMRLLDHLVFVAEHDDHHLARIWQLRSFN